MPLKEISKSATARLGAIGEQLRKTQQNYEEAFLKETGDANRVKPKINEAIIYKVFKNFGI